MIDHVNIADIITALGWAGAILALSGYILVSTGRVSPQSAFYQGLMLVSSLGFCVSTAYTGVWSSFATNAVFVVVGLSTLAVIGARPGSPVRRVAQDCRRAVRATGRSVARSAATFARHPRPAVSVLGDRRHEIDELLESTQQAGLEVAVVAHTA